MTQQERAQAFETLHRRPGCFVIPNPWDAGSARLLAGLGFEALATTSAGLAFSLGRRDGGGLVSRAETLANAKAIVEATPLPVAADLENCFAHDPRQAAETIRLAAEAGLVGGSIEDASGDPTKPIYDFSHAVERVAAAVDAARSLPFKFMLCARAENLLHGIDDLDDTIRRLQAFEKAGADVLYAPALRTLDALRAVCGAVGKPVNVLVGAAIPGFTVASVAAAGAKRISVGGAFARAALGGLMRAARELSAEGTFEWAKDALPFAEAQNAMRGGAK